MAVRFSTWMVVAALAMGAMETASAQILSPRWGPHVIDYTGTVINGVASPVGYYRAPSMPGSWLVPSYVFHYQAPAAVFVAVPAPERPSAAPAVTPVPVTLLTLRSGARPAEARVKPGAIVTWLNAGPQERSLVVNVTSVAAGQERTAAITQPLKPGGSFSLVFHEPGVYEYQLADERDHRAHITVER